VTCPKPSMGTGEAGKNTTWQILANFALPSEPGNERQAMVQVVEAVKELNLSDRRLERLETAVAEATMNAMEHGNDYRPEAPVTIRVLASEMVLSVCITDEGGGGPISEPESPDLEAKLASQEAPRGWGLFLIQNMVDEVRIIDEEGCHTIELILHLKGEDFASKKTT
jgi:anti-sigma regulatory factor (Ser/Thr protein kinase)